MNVYGSSRVFFSDSKMLERVNLHRMRASKFKCDPFEIDDEIIASFSEKDILKIQEYLNRMNPKTTIERPAFLNWLFGRVDSATKDSLCQYIEVTLPVWVLSNSCGISEELMAKVIIQKS